MPFPCATSQRRWVSRMRRSTTIPGKQAIFDAVLAAQLERTRAVFAEQGVMTAPVEDPAGYAGAFEETERRVLAGFRIEDLTTAAAFAQYVSANGIVDVNVFSSQLQVLQTACAGKPGVRAILDCSDMDLADPRSAAALAGRLYKPLMKRIRGVAAHPFPQRGGKVPGLRGMGADRVGKQRVAD